MHRLKRELRSRTVVDVIPSKETQRLLAALDDSVHAPEDVSPVKDSAKDEDYGQEHDGNSPTLSPIKDSNPNHYHHHHHHHHQNNVSPQRLHQVDERPNDGDDTPKNAYDTAHCHEHSPDQHDKAVRSERFKNHFTRVTEANREYFKHLAGECRCTRCACHNEKHHKCVVRPLKYDTAAAHNYKTVYGQTFRQYEGARPVANFKPATDGVPMYFPEAEEGVSPLISTHRHLYDAKTSRRPYEEVTEVKRDTLKPVPIPMGAQSVYAQSFGRRVIPKNILFTPLQNLPGTGSLALRDTTELRHTQQRTLRAKRSDVRPLNWAAERESKFAPPIGVAAAEGGPIAALQKTSVYRQTFSDWRGSGPQGDTDAAALASARQQQSHPVQVHHLLQPQYSSRLYASGSGGGGDTARDASSSCAAPGEMTARLPPAATSSSNMYDAQHFETRRSVTNLHNSNAKRGRIITLDEIRQRTTQSIFDVRPKAYDGQFKSTTKTDFTRIDIPQCSARLEPSDNIMRLAASHYRGK